MFRYDSKTMRIGRLGAAVDDYEDFTRAAAAAAGGEIVCSWSLIRMDIVY